MDEYGVDNYTVSRGYRICYRPSCSAPTYSIHEVYYDETGKICYYAKEPYTAFGDIMDELYRDMCGMMDSFDEEPLNLDLLDKQFQEKSRKNTPQNR